MLSPSTLSTAEMEPANMFDSLRIPKIQGRRALLILNAQKAAFNPADRGIVANPPDLVERIRRIIPYYRKTETEIVWIQTEAPEKKDKTFDLRTYTVSSQPEGRPTSDSSDNAGKLDPSDDRWKDDAESRFPALKKMTNGAEIADDLIDLFDGQRDICITKTHYSAFDETPLLMGLRMKMVTDIHICGCLSNVSVIYSAAEAVSHGFDVSVVEDCVGYHHRAMHIEAMEKMADNLGVNGVDSDEVIVEAGGNAPPDADPDMFSGPGFSGINIATHSNTAAQGTDNSRSCSSKSRRLTPKESEQESMPVNRANGNETSTNTIIGEGDCKVIDNALPQSIAKDAFEKLRAEVKWFTMMHKAGEVPRRVSVQGEIGANGEVPVYRHPADEAPQLMPFSPTVQAIRNEVSRQLKQPFNHVLVQLYRSGTDNIGEHSDKTLDIVRGSNIINVSLGAERKMDLKIKKAALTAEQLVQQRPRTKVQLPHNSIFVLGSKTNARWLHSVRPDKRLLAEKRAAEMAYNGERISLTFRNIGTWTDEDQQKIWGQGASKKTKVEVDKFLGDIHADGNVKSLDSDEAERMLIAFGKENHQVDFDWDKEYGGGFDVLGLDMINQPAT